MLASGPLSTPSVNASLSCKRTTVLILAAAIFIVAVIGIGTCFGGELLCIIINIIVILGSILGVYGAWRMDPFALGWFLVALFVLIVLQVVALILDLMGHAAIRAVILDIVLLALLAIGAGFTTDLRYALGVGPGSDPSMTQSILPHSLGGSRI